MMLRFWQKYGVCLLFVLLFPLSSCAYFSQENPGLSTEEVSERECDTIDEGLRSFASGEPSEISAVINNISFDVMQNREDELVFSVSADDFITNYNSLYYADYGTDFLPPLSQWTRFVYSSVPHSPYETYYYRFQQTPGVSSVPALSLYIPTNENVIQEITLDFDDHGYTEQGHQAYKEECMYVLQMLFPALDNDGLAELFGELFSMACSETCFVDEWEDVSPRVLYYTEDVGIYPYYALGMVHICIVPISQAYLDALVNMNAEIYELFKD